MRKRATGRTVIVGDVHGCREELVRLLDKVGFDTDDQLVFVGDLVARGPDSTGVLDMARRTGAVIVRGNHEEKLLAWYATQRARRSLHPARARTREVGLGRMHFEVARALRDTDWAMLVDSRFSFELPEHAACVVHAGVLPGVPMTEQSDVTLTRIRRVTTGGELSEDKEGPLPLWGALYTGPPHIVFGHNAMADPQLHPWATGIDTACVYGGRLTAMVLEPGQPVPRGKDAARLLVSEPATRVHYDWTRKGNVA